LESINEALAAKARIGTLLQHVVLAVLIGAANMSGDVIYNTYLAETIEGGQVQVEGWKDDFGVALGGSTTTTTVPSTATTTTSLPVDLDGAGVCACGDGFDQITDQAAEHQQQTADSLEQLVALMVALVNATLANK
jgi:hypothetical protein